MNKEIQVGRHTAVEDAKAAMELYLVLKDEWESSDRSFLALAFWYEDQKTIRKDFTELSNITDRRYGYLWRVNLPSPEFIQNGQHCICKFNTLETEATGDNAKHAAAEEMLELMKNEPVEAHAKAIIADRIATVKREWKIKTTDKTLLNELNNFTEKLQIPYPEYVVTFVNGKYKIECSVGSYKTKVRPYFIYQKFEKYFFREMGRRKGSRG